MATWRRVIDECRVHTVEVRGETPALPGRLIVCREHFFPVQIDGQVVGLGAVVEDITEQRETEEKLYDSERRFRLFADNIDDALWMTRPDDGVILYASPAYESIWGRSLARLYENADEWIDGVHPDDRQRVAAAFAAFGPDGGGYDVEFRVVRPDGAIRWVRDRGFPVRDESGGCWSARPESPRTSPSGDGPPSGSKRRSSDTSASSSRRRHPPGSST